jgi:hypothetical protein
VVYRTTFTHNMKSNVAIARKYRPLIQEMSRLHQVPAPMAEAVIAWENSGGITRRSWAECVGVGQLSRGAVESAHGFYRQHVKALRRKARLYVTVWNLVPYPVFAERAIKARQQADLLDLDAKHARLRKSLGIADERLIPECNVEDAVVYLKILYNNYGGRLDLAISAYHNGGLNNNDIIRSHLARNGGPILGVEASQKEIMAGIEQKKLRYIDLWKDSRSRDMLNGLRTVFGEVTGDHNSADALGDESDIYPWKVAAAYGALNAPDELLDYLAGKYMGDWDVVECRGMALYDSPGAVRAAIKEGRLVPLPKIFSDWGIASLPGASPEYWKERSSLNYYTSPETAGFLIALLREYRRRTGNPRLKVPLGSVLESRQLESYGAGSVPRGYHPHLQGAAVDVCLEMAPYRSVLYRILKEWFLYDRIFFVNTASARRVTVNPRYGKYYYNVYRDFVSRGKI